MLKGFYMCVYRESKTTSKVVKYNSSQSMWSRKASWELKDSEKCAVEDRHASGRGEVIFTSSDPP